jgi:radical SAM protein with 4Fe4S-binding SPASM domain
LATGRRSVEKDRYLEIVNEAARAHQPLTATWELTHRCNTRCVHCYVLRPDAEAARRELTLPECASVLEQLVDLGVLNLTLTGGEILLRPDLLDVVRRARDLRFAVRLKTNGTLVTPEVADRIAELYVVAVDISLYGACADTHDRITQVPGSFDRVMGAFRLLVERKVQVWARTPLMETNLAELDRMRSLAGDLGVHFHYSPNISVRDDGCDAPLRHSLSDESLLALFQVQSKAFDVEPGEDRYAGQICSAGRNQLCLGPYGDVYPCVQLRWSGGNVRERPLADIWRSSSALNRVRHLTWPDLETCVQCDVRDYCLPCVGQAWLEHGDLLAPSAEVCRQTRLRARVAEKIQTSA